MLKSIKDGSSLLSNINKNRLTKYLKNNYKSKKKLHTNQYNFKIQPTV